MSSVVLLSGLTGKIDFLKASLQSIKRLWRCCCDHGQSIIIKKGFVVQIDSGQLRLRIKLLHFSSPGLASFELESVRKGEF